MDVIAARRAFEAAKKLSEVTLSPVSFAKKAMSDSICYNKQNCCFRC